MGSRDWISRYDVLYGHDWHFTPGVDDRFEVVCLHQQYEAVGIKSALRQGYLFVREPSLQAGYEQNKLVENSICGANVKVRTTVQI